MSVYTYIRELANEAGIVKKTPNKDINTLPSNASVLGFQIPQYLFVQSYTWDGLLFLATSGISLSIPRQALSGRSVVVHMFL